MAVLAFSAIGGAIGGSIGYAGAGWVIGSMIGQAIFAEDFHSTQEGPRLDNLKAQTSTYGRDIPVVYGAMRVGGNVIWSAGIDEQRHETTTGGGKGGPSVSSTQVTYTYSSSFAVALCEGEIGAVSRIWADSRLIYDASANVSASTLFSSLSTSESITSYFGTEAQTADPLIESYEGVGNVPAFRGMAYLVFEDLQLEKYGNRIPNITAEIVESASLSNITELTRVEPTGKTFPVNGDPGDQSIIMHGFDGGVVRVGSFNDLPTGDIESVVYSFDLDGNYLGPMTATAEELLYPFGNSVGRIKGHDIYFIVANLSTAIDHVTKLLQVNFNNGYITDLTKVLPLGEYVGAASLSTDGSHAIVFTAPSDASGFSSVIDKWYIVNISGGAITLIRSGTLNTARAMQDLGWGAMYSYVFAVSSLEEDLTNFWTAYGAGTGDVYLYTIDSNDVMSRQSVGTINHNFAFVSLHTKDTICAIVSEDEMTVFTRMPLVTSTPTTLSSIVSDICLKAGLAAGDIDVTALTDTVDGYVSNRQSTARGLIEPLQQAFLFDVIESDYKLVFVNRGAGSVITVDEDDLGATDGQHKDKIIRNRMNEMELPRKLSIVHLDPATDYQENVETASRLITDSINVMTLNAPISMSTTKAAQMSHILLGRVWIERDQYVGFIPFEYIKANPSDIFTINIDGTIHTILLTEISYKLPGIIQFRGVAEDTAQYDSSAIGAEGGFSPQAVAVPGPTNLELLDIPLLRDQDNTNGYYIAASGYLPGWGFANLYKSIDGGDSWNSITTITAAVPMGLTTDVLADGITTIIDNGSTVNIRMSSGTLSSSTEANILNGDNACLIGDELLHFITATLESDGTYTLSGLLRGRKGTERATADHAIADRFVFLSESTLLKIDQDADEIGVVRDYKAVTIGQTLQGSVSESFTNNAARLKPLSPVHIDGSRDGSDNLTITWIRRGRVSASWRDYVDVPLGEDSESYEVDVVSGSPEVVARTITASSETASYTAAQQTSDGFTPGDPVNVKIYQLSATVGRGYAGNATI